MSKPRILIADDEEGIRESLNLILGDTYEVAFARDGSFALASYINEAIAIGDWTFFTTFMEKIQRVSEKDVLRVLEKYFVPEQSTVGHYISTVTTSHEK